MSQTVEQWTDSVGERVMEQLQARALPLTPKRVLVHEETDPLGEDAWRVVLVLRAPTGETWDRFDVFRARRAAVDIFDEITAEDQRSLPGSTIAIVTTDEAAENDIAVEDAPEEGEDPGLER